MSYEIKNIKPAHALLYGATVATLTASIANKVALNNQFKTYNFFNTLIESGKDIQAIRFTIETFPTSKHLIRDLLNIVDNDIGAYIKQELKNIKRKSIALYVIIGVTSVISLINATHFIRKYVSKKL